MHSIHREKYTISLSLSRNIDGFAFCCSEVKFAHISIVTWTNCKKLPIPLRKLLRAYFRALPFDDIEAHTLTLSKRKKIPTTTTSAFTFQMMLFYAHDYFIIWLHSLVFIYV